jgi:hypothetical protein
MEGFLALFTILLEKNRQSIALPVSDRRALCGVSPRYTSSTSGVTLACDVRRN